MIILSIILCIFANAIRFAELAENTTVRTLKDYINYSHKIFYGYNFCWILITLVTFLISKT